MPAIDRPRTTTDVLSPQEGATVRLRAHRQADLDDFFALYSDPEVMRYWSFPAWTHIEQARDRFASTLACDPQRLVCWAIAERDSDRLVGGVTLHSIDAAQGRAEIGYALRRPYWGRGMAGEAMRLAIAHAFDVLELRRIEADIDPRNGPSCRLIERLGFHREGLLRERWQVAGDLQDSAIYGLLAHEWGRDA
ncbi:GNAT family N-acetyltransferase [Montanilutibacter psychrotolerans]|uniref:N-acetyltransferase n=1 Tax=Montanilutibacter psychrotolerans TaxID=1327343 RepID=A0A3M8SXC0_9GAMM|nr:GNAT family N-acetyltransferase [Lysobacter psychrotolerans]RNF85937.1 N-acetyltransferase [Lysobacter psychrotolerans]